MISSVEFVSFFNGISGIVLQPSDENHLTRSVLGDVLKALEKVYGDEELLEVSMDEAKTAVDCIDQQSELNDLTIDAMVTPKMEFGDSSFPLVWFLLKIRPNRDKKIKKKTLKVERYITQKQIGMNYYVGCKEIVQEWGDMVQRFWSLNNESTTSDIPQLPSYRTMPGNEDNGTNTQKRIEENATVRAIREAVEAVMEARDDKGGRVFCQQSQWSGIWLILHDGGYYKESDSGFAGYLRSLGLVPKEPLHLKRVELFKDFGKRRPKNFASWNPDGAKGEMRVYEVARIFKEEIEKRLPQN